MPGGLAGAFLGNDMMQEIDKRFKLITDELCPRIDAMKREQEKTNDLLKDIIVLLRKLDHP